MLEYKSLNQYELKDRGIVYVVENDNGCPRDDFKSFIGKEVKIDGVIYTVKGVESFAIPFIGKGQTIGLLV